MQTGAGRREPLNPCFFRSPEDWIIDKRAVSLLSTVKGKR